MAPGKLSTCRSGIWKGGNLATFESPIMSHFFSDLILLDVFTCLVALRVGVSVCAVRPVKSIWLCTAPEALLGVSLGVAGLLTRGVVLWPGTSGLFNKAKSSLVVRSTMRAELSAVGVVRDGGGAD